MNTYEVLFVDDDKKLAAGYARLIGNRLEVECIATDKPTDALKLVSEGSIRVAVLDQRMPITSGVELMREIHQISPTTRVIILSGLAEGREIAEAYDGGTVKFLQKNNARAQLPAVIEAQLLDFEIDLSEKYRAAAESRSVFSTSSSKFPFGRKLRFYLLESATLDEKYIFDASWQTAGRIDAGIESEIIFEIEWKASSETLAKLGTLTGADFSMSAGKLSKLSLKLAQQITSSTEYKDTTEARDKTSQRRRVSLPPEPTNPDALHIRARAYEFAPVFTLVRSTLLGRCGECSAVQLFKKDTYLPRRRYATRQIDYMSDNSEPRIQMTGVHDLI
ncbi:response regulator transcription factor [Kribbella sp. CA-293567]|uniref:response regulator transcription factor n=1 Tax=Kribbella sp. CA-293567 TaxID=3002436 RepID=UPI0022DE069C|nr:response regulator [Kribbella sp. CA-293567]WBQ05307.1 response regulator [Kribbella sp. CA-293567]